MNFNEFFKECLTNMEQYPVNITDIAKEKTARYFFYLMQAQAKMNLTAYRTIDAFVRYHLLDTLELSFCIHFQPGMKLLDVGSGGGVPGLLLAAMYDWQSVVLVESIQKKAEFLASAAREMGLDGVEVHTERAEDLAHHPDHRDQYDIVTARALAPLPQALELTAAFIKPGGTLFLPRGAGESTETATVLKEALGITLEQTHEYTLPGRNEAFRVFIYKKTTSTQDKYPRKPGQIRKHPL